MAPAANTLSARLDRRFEIREQSSFSSRTDSVIAAELLAELQTEFELVYTRGNFYAYDFLLGRKAKGTGPLEEHGLPGSPCFLTAGDELGAVVDA